MTTTLADMDQQAITSARELAALRTISELTAYFAADRGADSIAAQNPLATFFGRGTMVLADMLAIIVRQQAEISRLSDENTIMTHLLSEAQIQIADA